MSDLVERLRAPLELQFAVPVPAYELLQCAADERGEAAVEIERLRERAHELSMALMPFALMTRDDGSPADEGYPAAVIVRFEAKAGEIQFARETLQKWSPQLFKASASPEHHSSSGEAP